MHNVIKSWLAAYNIEMTELVSILSALALIFIISVIIHIFLHKVVIRSLERLALRSTYTWTAAFFGSKLFKRLALALQGIIIYVQARLWLSDDSFSQPLLQTMAHLWVIMFILLSLFSLLNTVLELGRESDLARRLPVRGLFQGVKLTAAIIAGILMIAVLIGKSPLILFSSLGAMTAVTMLVFKDSIMGLVAGIQLSANKMLEVGDWLEMPKYGADGDVIDIGLTTVKVRNFDKTITTIPTYALISDSFRNWRGMFESGGRRIKRSFNIDVNSVRFLNEDDLERLYKARLLEPYLSSKISEINQHNREQNVDLSSLINGRRLTNLGTLRAYLLQYLQVHPGIHKEMIQMVRQLQPEADGIPMELYCFTSTTNWVDYEVIQADIFDHIFAVLPAFDLRAHQSPTGYDIRALGAYKS